MNITRNKKHLALVLTAIGLAHAPFGVSSATAGSADRINAIINGLHGGVHSAHHWQTKSYRHEAYTYGRWSRDRGYKPAHGHFERKRHAHQVAVRADREFDYRGIHLGRSQSILVNFAPGSSRIMASQRAALDELGYALESRRLVGRKFLIIGHTDASGSRQQNLRLSKRRADAVRSYLLTHFAIAPHRLVSIGFGEERLHNPSNPYSFTNRRVEVAVITPEIMEHLGNWLHNDKYSEFVSERRDWAYRY